MTHLGRRLGKKARNTARRIAQRTQAQRLVAANPNLSGPDLLNRLVAQREDANKVFRTLPAELIRRVTGRRPR